MIHVLHVLAGSEAEAHFMDLIEATKSKIIKVVYSEIYDGALCNRYEIDEDTFQKIKTYLEERRA